MPRTSLHREEPDEGFTLIELLVVVIIIGILAGIAIPAFLHHRERAYDAVAKSDLNQLAQFEEMYIEDHDSYATIAELVGSGMEVGPSRGATLWVLNYEGERSFCLKARADGSSRQWFYDSAAGGLQPKGTAACPVTTGGTPGDSVSR